MKNLSLFTLLAITGLFLVSTPVLAGDQRAVLITGATSGIGLRTAEHLSASGFFVYAGARKQADMDRLNKMDNVEAVRLDVTVPADIAAAVAQIQKGGRGLHGVVNNAGVAILAPLTEVSEEEMDFIFNVNVFDPYRVTKAFAPLLIESKGRVVNISSISGVLSAPLFGPYSMTKHALEAFNDSLAREMQRFGVQVAAIEPGNFDSQIGASAIKRMQEKGIRIEDSAYEQELLNMVKWAGNIDNGADPIAVARAVEQALVSTTPKARYLVVPRQQEAERTLQKAIQELLELNQEHAYSYDKSTLLKMLEEQYDSLAGDSTPENKEGERS